MASARNSTSFLLPLFDCVKRLNRPSIYFRARPYHRRIELRVTCLVPSFLSFSLFLFFSFGFFPPSSVWLWFTGYRIFFYWIYVAFREGSWRWFLSVASDGQVVAFEPVQPAALFCWRTCPDFDLKNWIIWKAKNESVKGSDEHGTQ